MKHALVRFLKEEDGATAIEYGLIAGLVALAIVLSLTNLGTSLGNAFQSIADRLTTLFPAAGA